MPYFKNTPISGDSGDRIVSYTKKELYDEYIKEGRSHTDALALSQELIKGMEKLNKQEIRMWQRSLREKGLWEPKTKQSLEV